MDSEYDYLFKILLVGDTMVGKSSILLKFVDNVFTHHSISTIGVDFKIKTIELGDKKAKFQIWDTAGQDRFRSIVSSYYRGAHGIIITYDVNEEESFQNITKWYDEIKHYANHPVLMLVGNKTDLGKREISPEMGKNLASQMGCGWAEVSAKEEDPETLLKKVFIPLAQEMRNYYFLKKEIAQDLEKKDTLRIGTSEIITNNLCCK